MRAQDFVRLLSLAALWGVLFVQEPLAVNMLARCALVLAGTWLALRDAPRRPRPVRPADQGSA